MTPATLDYLVRVAIQDRDESARRMVESGVPCPAWGEAAAAVRELLDMKGGYHADKEHMKPPQSPKCTDCGVEMYRYAEALDTSRDGWQCPECGWSEDDE